MMPGSMEVERKTDLPKRQKQIYDIQGKFILVSTSKLSISVSLFPKPLKITQCAHGSLLDCYLSILKVNPLLRATTKEKRMCAM